MWRGVVTGACVFLLMGCGGGSSGPIPAAVLPPDAPPTPVPEPVPPTRPDTPPVEFVDATVETGLLDPGPYTDLDFFEDPLAGNAFGSGACAGDFDGDGWLDLYHVRGVSGRNRLYRNQGDGTFQDVAARAGVDFESNGSAGPIFVDYDGDGLLDLFIGGTEGQRPRLLRNLGNATFLDVTEASGLTPSRTNSISAAFGDYDRDGDLDLCLTHWEIRQPVSGSPELLWRNNGDGTFSDVSTLSGLTDVFDGAYDYTFAPNFADIDSDGWLDLLITGDFGTSLVLVNQHDGTFRNATTSVISDQSGMGGTVGDYDNDGDLDWFVSAIFKEGVHAEDGPDPAVLHGNRLYRNDGGGIFEDVTQDAGVRQGSWGWGSSFADFNNDGHLDIYHCNGWLGQRRWEDVASILFLAQGDGSFKEVAESSGLVGRGQGRGVVCFDFDRDGDLDIFEANLHESGRFYRNDTPGEGHWLGVLLVGPAPNTQAIGARVWARVGDQTYLRELRCGSNYVSSDPVGAHFGLGAATRVDEVRVEWPGGDVTSLHDVTVDRTLTVRHEDAR